MIASPRCDSCSKSRKRNPTRLLEALGDYACARDALSGEGVAGVLFACGYGARLLRGVHADGVRGSRQRGGGERFGASGGWGGCGEGVVEAALAVGADGEDVAQHRHGVAEWADAAARHVVPGDGHFADAVAALAGHVEQLDVETPAGDGLLSAQLMRDFAAETLEATLGILNAGQKQDLHEGVEDAAHEVAVEGFGVAARADGLTRADSHVVCAEHLGLEAVEFLDGHGEVGVGEGDIVTGGDQNARADGTTFARVGPADETEQGRGGPGAYQAFHDGTGIVGAAVVGDDYLGGIGQSSKIVAKGVEAGG